jgi:hypothetical protein
MSLYEIWIRENEKIEIKLSEMSGQQQVTYIR